MAFRGVDYFAVDSLFSEEELMVRQTARRFVDERILPLIRDCYRDARFPAELIPEMAAIWASSAPTWKATAAPGMNNVEYGLIMQELERVRFRRAQLRLRAGRAGDVPHPRFRLRGAEANAGCRALQSGEAVGCFGLTEPDFGSNPAGMRTTARRDGDAWVLNGEKTWITNGGIGRRGRGLGARPGRHRGFPGGDAARPGYTTSDIHGKWSMRASVTSSLSFPIAACRSRPAARRRGLEVRRWPA